jgi:hypothetical protein
MYAKRQRQELDRDQTYPLVRDDTPRKQALKVSKGKANPVTGLGGP